MPSFHDMKEKCSAREKNPLQSEQRFLRHLKKDPGDFL